MSVPPLPSLRDRLFVAMQHALPQHFLSRIVLRVTRIRLWPVKNLLIRSFLRGFKVNMSEAAQPNPLQYPSFNAFFTRALRHGARAIDIDPGALVSPVDGTVSQIGRLDGSKLLQAKGHDYTLEALLDGAPEWAQLFAGGAFATLYLAPYNYHRIHMPIAGTLRAAWFVPGNLFSVNAVTAAAVPGLFAKNERVVCVFEDGPRAFAMVLVGALFVGSIATVWHGDVAPRSPRQRVDLPLDTSRSPLKLSKGAEMGRFNMGSTVILLTPPDLLNWLPKFATGSRVEVGQMLARLR
ncbi:MAG: Phosphatidylserine decarboxylase proenzyme [Gammaproteobacteria bacterium]|jgi:phosphatidylserine decarboxylase|nr:Phosphatidylserine decarboxylase proenzyme [Gammaproteobacteria bacterium]